MYRFIQNKNVWDSDDYHLHFDINSSNKMTMLQGWFVNKNVVNYELRLIDSNGKLIKKIDCLINRPKLCELYPKIKDVNNSGFEVDIKELSESSNYFISIFKDEKEITKVIKINLSINKKPLLYIHIAKTAGSTVNNFLTDLFGINNSIIHAESKNTWEESVHRQNVSFLSGHIPYKAFLRVEELESYKKAITFREPYSHVVSHISWIRALTLQENKLRYDAHPKYIQELSDKLTRYDLSRPKEIAEIIKNLTPTEYMLLDNTQTRYIRTDLSKNSVDEVDFNQAIDNLAHFDFIGSDSNISGFLEKITTYYGFEYHAKNRRENVLTNKFGLNVNDPKIKKSLLPLIKYDLKLYDFIKKG